MAVPVEGDLAAVPAVVAQTLQGRLEGVVEVDGGMSPGRRAVLGVGAQVHLAAVFALEPPEGPETLRLGAALDPPVAEHVDEERRLPVETVDRDTEVHVVDPRHRGSVRRSVQIRS